MTIADFLALLREASPSLATQVEHGLANSAAVVPVPIDPEPVVKMFAKFAADATDRLDALDRRIDAIIRNDSQRALLMASTVSRYSNGHARPAANLTAEGLLE